MQATMQHRWYEIKIKVWTKKNQNMKSDIRGMCVSVLVEKEEEREKEKKREKKIKLV